MPDVYKKGAPHRPMTVLTGHFTGMMPVEDWRPELDKPETLWWRGDDFAALRNDFMTAIKGYAKVVELEAQLAKLIAAEVRLAELELDVHDLKARRPPKRMGEKHG